MTTIWTVNIEGEKAGEYGPFETHDAAVKFAAAYRPYATVNRINNVRLVDSYEIDRTEFETSDFPSMLLDPADTQ
jgi:hypothetical protein